MVTEATVYTTETRPQMTVWALQPQLTEGATWRLQRLVIHDLDFRVILLSASLSPTSSLPRVNLSFHQSVGQQPAHRVAS